MLAALSVMVLAFGCDYEPECREVEPAFGSSPGPVLVEVAAVDEEGCSPSSYWEFSYDDDGRRTRRQKFSAWTDQEGRVVDYYYDQAGQLQLEVERSPLSDVIRRQVDYFYEEGLLQKSIEYDGDYDSTHAFSYQYDEADRLIRRQETNESGEVIKEAIWSYDELGRIAERLEDTGWGGAIDGEPDVRCTYSHSELVTQIDCDGGSYELDGTPDEHSEFRFDEYGNILDRVRSNYLWIRGYGDTRWVYQYR